MSHKVSRLKSFLKNDVQLFLSFWDAPSIRPAHALCQFTVQDISLFEAQWCSFIIFSHFYYVKHKSEENSIVKLIDLTGFNSEQKSYCVQAQSNCQLQQTKTWVHFAIVMVLSVLVSWLVFCLQFGQKQDHWLLDAATDPTCESSVQSFAPVKGCWRVISFWYIRSTQKMKPFVLLPPCPEQRELITRVECGAHWVEQKHSLFFSGIQLPVTSPRICPD